MIHNLVTGESLTTFRNLVASSYDTPLIGTTSAGSSVLRAQVSGTVENGTYVPKGHDRSLCMLTGRLQ